MFGNLTPEGDWQEKFIIGDKQLESDLAKLKEYITDEKIQEKKDRYFSKNPEDRKNYEELFAALGVKGSTYEEKVNNRINSFKDSIDNQIEFIEEIIKDKKEGKITEKKLYANYGGKPKFRKIVEKSKISALEELKRDDLEYFDEKWAILTKEADEKLKNALENKPAPVDKKNTISFMEVYGNLEGESELKELKNLLQD